MYNDGRFDESIAAAAIAKHKPDSVPSATLIEARARLERFRQNGDAGDLGAARAALVSLNPRVLAPQEIIEWQIGIGTALFLENQPGPAAEMFATVLPAARERLSPAELDKLVEWWASTVGARRRIPDGLRAKGRLHCHAVGGARQSSSAIRCRGRRPTGWSSRHEAPATWTTRGTRPSLPGFAPVLNPRAQQRSRRPRPLRDADTHPRTGTGAHGSTPRFEGDRDRDRGADRAVARARRALAVADLSSSDAHAGRPSCHKLRQHRAAPARL